MKVCRSGIFMISHILYFNLEMSTLYNYVAYLSRVLHYLACNYRDTIGGGHAQSLVTRS